MSNLENKNSTKTKSETSVTEALLPSEVSYEGQVEVPRAKRKYVKYTTITLIIATILFWLPWLVIKANSQDLIIQDKSQLHHADAAIIFGAVVTDSEISPLQAERLDTAIMLFDDGIIDQIVISNTADAATTMKEYLIKYEIPENVIEMDTQAETTADTCKYESSKYTTGRDLILISQGFHLPRVSYLCKKYSIIGQGYPAELINAHEENQYSVLTIARIRAYRYTREAALTWVALLNIYN